MTDNTNLVELIGTSIHCRVVAVPKNLSFFVVAKSKKEKAVVKAGNIPERMNLFRHTLKAKGWQCEATRFDDDGIYFEVIFP